MTRATPQIVVAGHLCVDVIPEFEQGVSSLATLLTRTPHWGAWE